MGIPEVGADASAESRPDDSAAQRASIPMPTGWTFLTNHALVLLAIARDGDITLREVATRVGITERSAQNIVADLVDAGYLTRTRLGRRNSYTIPAHRPMRHPLNAGHDLDELLELLVPPNRQG
jgi:predicted HTH transcriptional regulator